MTDPRDARPDIPWDALDLEILSILSRDSRLSTRAVAREVGRSPGAVGERISRLEAAGVINGYRLEIDLSKLGLMQTLVGVTVESDADLDACVEAVLALEEVQLLWVVTGSWSIVAQAFVRDAAHLRELLHGKLRAIDGVRRSESMIVLDAATASTNRPSLPDGRRNAIDPS